MQFAHPALIIPLEIEMVPPNRTIRRGSHRQYFYPVMAKQTVFSEPGPRFKRSSCLFPCQPTNVNMGSEPARQPDSSHETTSPPFPAPFPFPVRFRAEPAIWLHFTIHCYFTIHCSRADQCDPHVDRGFPHQLAGSRIRGYRAGQLSSRRWISLRGWVSKV